ncbi:MAG: 50S ribosomal protein L29 [Candidatus Magasanikbacteria bacterium]|nr:50S ribosomal protein L29 [Candidatus Magasanikbacteria bacterium]
MDYQEIKTKNVNEIKGLILEKSEELRDLRFKLQSQQLKAMHKMQDTKKMIARLQTALRATAK